MTTKTMTEKQMIAKEKAVYNLFKKITKERHLASRPILQCINLTEDGKAIATDSHRLLQVKDFHDKKENMLLNGKTGEVVEGGTFVNGEYPRTDRLIPRTENSVTLNVTESYGLLKRMMKDRDKDFKSTKNKVLNLKLENDKIALKPAFIEISDSFNAEEYMLDLQDLETEFETNMNHKFLLDGLLMFKQAKIKEVTLRYVDSKIRPFVLEAESITYLVTPVRIMN